MKFWKRFVASALTIMLLCITCEMQLYAEEEAKTPEELAQEEMNAVHALPVDTNALDGWPQGPSIFADSAVVMDIGSGAILYDKRSNEQHYPASITKILTTLVALENAELTDKVTFSEDSISFLEYGDAHIGMKPGEEISLEDALYAVLLASANEVSYAVAESVGTTMGGGYDTFIQAMNDRAKEIGCTNSHWVNANGLHDDQHYTTAHDMAVIGAEVFGHEEFRKITSTLQHIIPPTNLVPEQRVFQQNHKMLQPSNPHYYEYCVGGKTGFTDQAKTTLVTFADNGDMQLVAVNLKSYGVNVYTDTRAMFDYVYGNFSKVSLEECMDKEKIEKYLEDDAYVVLPKGIEVSQLEEEYEPIEDEQRREARVSYTYEGQPVGSAKVVLQADFYKKLTGKSDPIVQEVKKTEKKEKEGFSLPVKIMMGVAAVLILAGVCYCYIHFHRINQRRRRRKAAYKNRTKNQISNTTKRGKKN